MISDEKHVKSKQWPQILATLSCSLITIGAGLHFGWPASAIPKILSNEFPKDISKNEASYILLVGPLSYIVAAPLFAIFSDRVGRKKTLLFLAIPQLIAWILIANSKSLLVFCGARLVSSFSEGGLLAVYPMYIGEITEPKVRGVLGSTLSLTILFGQFSITAYGSFISLTTSAYISCMVPLLFLATFSWMPESPYFLLMKNRRKDAEKSLQILRRMSNVDEELAAIEAGVKRQMSESNSVKDLFTIESNRKALEVMFWIRNFQQFCGLAPMGFYSQIIFEKCSDFLSPKLSSIIFFLIEVITIFGTSLIIDKFGRRILFMISCVTTSVCLLILGLYFVFEDKGYNMSSFSLVPLITMNFYMVFLSCGLAITPNLMMGELFSTRVKVKALSFCAIHFALCVSLMSQIFHLLKVNFGFYAPFFFFSVCTLLGTFYGYYWMPETKGKTLEEIQLHLKRPKKSENINSSGNK